jgi:hypothetical protein
VKGQKKGIILKLDYEKAYDGVNWHFLEEMMSSRGFGSKWRSLVMKLVKGGSIAIRLNDIYMCPIFNLVKALHKEILFPLFCLF